MPSFGAGHRPRGPAVRALFPQENNDQDVQQFFLAQAGNITETFCNACDKCQHMSVKNRVRSVHLKPLPIIPEPFSRVAIDIVGPLSPSSSECHRYILYNVLMFLSIDEESTVHQVASPIAPDGRDDSAEAARSTFPEIESTLSAPPERTQYLKSLLIFRMYCQRFQDVPQVMHDIQVSSTRSQSISSLILKKLTNSFSRVSSNHHYLLILPLS